MVVSAMAGTTDALLGVAQQAGAGESRTVASLIARLRSRHAEVARALLPAGRGRADLLAYIGDVFEELEALAQGLRLLRELTPRTTDYLASRGERLSARLVAAALEATRDQGKVRGCPRPRPHRRRVRPGRARLRADRPRASQRALLPLLARGIIPVVPGFIGATPDGEVATLGRGGSDLTATLLARALGAARVSLWKDVPGPAHRRSAGRARRAGHPAAPRPRGGRAGLLRRQGAAPARADPGRGPPHPGLRAARSATRTRRAPRCRSGWRRRGSRSRRSPRPAARRWSRSPATGCSACPASRPAPSTRCTRARSRCRSSPRRRRSTRSASACPRRSRPTRARASSASSAARSRAARSTASSCSPGMATVAVVGLGHARHARRRGGGVLRARGGAGSTSWPSRRAARSSTSPSWSRRGRPAEAQRRIHAAFQLSRIAGGGVIQPERMEVVLLGFGQIGRTLAALIGQGPPARARPQGGGGHRPLGLRVRPAGAGAAAARRARRGEAEGPAAWPTPPRGRAATAEEAIRHIASYALTRPVLVDLTADETAPALEQALTHGMDLVLANKRPLAGRRAVSESLWQTARARGRRRAARGHRRRRAPDHRHLPQADRERRPGRADRGPALRARSASC